jgi:ATP-dependent Lon protease
MYRLPVCADSVAQLRELRPLISTHHETFEHARQKPADPGTSNCLPFFDEQEFEDRQEWAAQLRDDAKTTVQGHLTRADSLGSRRRVALAPAPQVFDQLARDFPHFEEVTESIRRSAILCRTGTAKFFRVPPMLICGPPGVGKTAYVQQIAKTLTQADPLSMTVPYAKVDVGALTAKFSISGLDISYATGRPGLLWDLLQHECMSPVVALDELDKLNEHGENHLGALYTLLERTSARRFVDAAIGLAVDASHITWFATCNDADLVEAAMRSRFKIVHVRIPTPDEMRPVVRSIHRVLLENADWASAFEPELPVPVVDALSHLTPREAGQALEDAYAAAANAGRRNLAVCDVRVRPTPTKRSIGFRA